MMWGGGGSSRIFCSGYWQSLKTGKIITSLDYTLSLRLTLSPKTQQKLQVKGQLFTLCSSKMFSLVTSKENSAIQKISNLTPFNEISHPNPYPDRRPLCQVSQAQTPLCRSWVKAPPALQCEPACLSRGSSKPPRSYSRHSKDHKIVATISV